MTGWQLVPGTDTGTERTMWLPTKGRGGWLRLDSRPNRTETVKRAVGWGGGEYERDIDWALGLPVWGGSTPAAMVDA